MRALLHRDAAALASWAAFARLRRLLAPLLLSRAARLGLGSGLGLGLGLGSGLGLGLELGLGLG